ncbi:MAG: amino acid permease [Gemmataceae bacterium]|nr:amino acid permease [Gemmataceae bacterium]
MAEHEDPGQPVKPRLGLFDAVSIMVGIVIGSSIFESAPVIFNSVPSPAWAMAVWVLGGVLSLVGALCYAELASTYPRSGGDYVYLTRAYGPWAGFLFGWAQLAVVITASIGAMAFVFGRYAAAFMAVPNEALRKTLEASPDAWETKVTLAVSIVPDGQEKQWIAYLAIGAVVALTLMNLLGVVLGKTVQNLLTLVKLTGLGAIVYFGFQSPQQAAFAAPEAAGGANFTLAMILVLYAYGGWNDMAFVAAEMRNKRSIPRALIAGTSIITLFYLAVNAAYIMALGWDGVRKFYPPVASAVLSKELGDFAGRGMSVLVMISALGAINGLIFTGSRVYSSLGNDWRIFAVMGHWNKSLGSPVYSLLIQAGVAVAMIFGVGTEDGRKAIDGALVGTGKLLQDTTGLHRLEMVIHDWPDAPPPDINQVPVLDPLPWDKYRGGFDTLVAGTAPVFWLFFLGTGVALFALRQRDPDLPRPFTVPWFPLLPLIFCGMCFFMLYRALDYAETISLLGWIPLALGLPLYYLSGRTDSPNSQPTPPAAPEPEPAAVHMPTEGEIQQPPTVEQFIVPDAAGEAPVKTGD